MVLAEVVDVFLRVANRADCCHNLVTPTNHSDTFFRWEVPCNVYLCIYKTNAVKCFRRKVYKLTTRSTLSSPETRLLSLSVRLKYRAIQGER